jgi:hypothetical protein
MYNSSLLVSSPLEAARWKIKRLYIFERNLAAEEKPILLAEPDELHSRS